jgi:hypothetical protein
VNGLKFLEKLFGRDHWLNLRLLLKIGCGELLAIGGINLPHGGVLRHKQAWDIVSIRWHSELLDPD